MDARFPAIPNLVAHRARVAGAGLVGRCVPQRRALSSVEPFSVDTLDFHQWLQWIFLVRMKQILEQDLPLPNASGILEMAEMVYADLAR